MGYDSKKRSIAKIISWHIIATVLTFCISYFFTGQIIASAKITFTGIFVGMALFYIHERVWDRIKWGKYETDNS